MSQNDLVLSHSAVTYDAEAETFSVVVKDLKNDKILPTETFTHVITTAGHNSTPHLPSYPGMESFPGLVLHAHDLRQMSIFQGQRVLLIGAKFTAEDVALQAFKFFISWHSQALGVKGPRTESND